MAFAWPWAGRPGRVETEGDAGFCSARGQQLLVQQGKNMKQVVQFSPLQNAQEPVLDRSERVQLTAARLAAEGETEEVRRRSSQLFDQNVELTRELQTLKTNFAHVKDVAADREKVLAQVQPEVARLSAENGRLALALKEAEAAEDAYADLSTELQRRAAENDALRSELDKLRAENERLLAPAQ
jgi:predicted RNase H-like nuclease (RuvC/YqgF family)